MLSPLALLDAMRIHNLLFVVRKVATDGEQNQMSQGVPAGQIGQLIFLHSHSLHSSNSCSYFHFQLDNNDT